MFKKKEPTIKDSSPDGGEEAIAMVDHTHWRAVFNKYDEDGDGFIPLREFKEKLLVTTNIRHELPAPAIDGILKKADRDYNGVMDYQEFIFFIQSPELPPSTRRGMRMFAVYATKMVLPRNKRPTVDTVDGRYIQEYNCYPPPITILAVSIIEIIVFIYYAVTLGNVSASGPVPFNSVLIYNPHKRYEAWRYVTYMLIHAGIIHILFNVLVQLLLGIPLELVHKYWRVWLVYMAGVIAGSLGTSITDPKVYLAGASGGVYALITGHLATIIMNYKEMDFALVQLLGFLFLGFFDFGVAIYNRYIAENPDKTTGYAAHLAGALAGLLLGIVALRNLETRPWEKVVWWISLSAFIAFILAMIIWNAAIPSYFPPSV